MTALYDHAGPCPKFVQPVLCGADPDTDSDADSEQGRDSDEIPDSDELPDTSAEEDASPDTVNPEMSDRTSEKEAMDGSMTKPKTWSKRGLFSKRATAARIGFCAQYFAVGLIYGGIPATTYGVFLGYLNVPAYVYATVAVISSLPWSFKFFFGLINDTCPIMGLHRKPYMMIGWTFCAVSLIVLSQIPLPPPYWCVDEFTGEYIKKVHLPDGTVKAAKPCHPEAAQQGGTYTFMLMSAAMGYVIADVAADGLTTEYAKAEPMDRRGSTQTTAYLTRTIGQAVSTIFIAFLMNSKLYNGSFNWGLSFNQVCFCLAIPAAIMVPISGLLVLEPKRERENALNLNEYFSMCWEMLKGKAFFFVVLYSFLNGAIGNISTTAGSQVKINWAGVQNFENQLFSLFGHFLFAFGLFMVKKKFLHSSWHKLLAITMIFLQMVDSFFTTFTIFDVFRNPFFYLGEAVLTEIPSAANFVVGTFVIVEMADDGNEGLVYGLLTTAGNLGSPIARAMANQIYNNFTPSLSDADNYIEDTVSFRWTVFWSFMLSYGFALLSLVTLVFLPRQKQEAQERKRTWKKRPVYAYITCTMLALAFAYSLTVNFLSMFPSTMCLKFAGGDGCDN